MDFPKGRRAAKREACKVVGLLIQQYLDTGQPWNDAREAGLGDDHTGVIRLSDAMVQLRDEMERRSDLAASTARIPR